MSSKTKLVEIPENSLTFAAETIARALLNDHTPAVPLRNANDVYKRARQALRASVQQGEYSYDPSNGEIIVPFHDRHGLDFLAKIPDGSLIGTHVMEALKEDGWEEVILLPRRTGVSKTLVKLRSDSIRAAALRLNIPQPAKGKK